MTNSKHEQLSQERKKLQAEGRLPPWYSTPAWQMFKSRYLVEEEGDVRTRFRKLAQLARYLPEPYATEYEQKFYDLMDTNVLSPSSPVLANTNTNPPRGMNVSCSGQDIPDHVHGFYQKLGETADLTKNAFGTSGSFSSIRPRGAPISSGGTASGAVPVIEDFFTCASKISQGGIRQGSFAAYLHMDHGDFDEACDSLHTDHKGKNYGWIITDVFVNRLMAKEPDTLRRWKKAIHTKLLTGKGYLFFIDKANRHRPDMYKKLGLDIKASNLCCMAADQRVVTDLGLVTVAELYASQYAPKLAGRGVISQGSPMLLPRPNAPMVKVLTSEGYSHKVTPDHRIWVVGKGWVEAQDLNQGDKIELQTQSLFGTEHNPKAFEHGQSFDGTHLPDYLWKADKETITNFISGLFEASVGNAIQGDIKALENIQILIQNAGEYSAVIAGTSLRLVDRLAEATFIGLGVLPNEDAYCLTVDSEDHAWTVNGLVTHNTEIMLHSSEEYSFSCILSSLNLFHWDKIKDSDAVFTAMVFLDCLCSDFIAKSEGIVGLEKVREFTLKGRAVGLGTMGFHTYLQSKRIPYESLEAHYLNTEIFKHIHDETLRASQWLAELLGEPEWCKGYGVRNTHRTAQAPTKSTAGLMGGMSESTSADPAMAYTAGSAAGEIARIPPVFLEVMKEKGVYNQDTITDIIQHVGSVQHVDWLDDHEKQVFKTAFEIDPWVVFRHAVRRQRYLCQGQSLNFYLPENDQTEDLISDLMSACAMEEEILSQYYIYTRSGVVISDECVACSA